MKRKLEQYMANGGTAVGLAQAGLGLFDGIMNVIENDPSAYSTQPIVNASTMKSMVSPYSKFATGGTVPIEVEDEEVVQEPGKPAIQVKGPTHEEGGINLDVVPGTNVYSDRLKIDGLTMQERKIKREKTMSKLSKMLEKNPTDKLLKGTIERTASVQAVEDEQDVAIQNAVRSPKQKFATGGTAGGDPVLDFIASMLGNKMAQQSNIKGFGNKTDLPNQILLQDNTGVQTDSTANTPAPTATKATDSSKLGLGDYLGLAGNAFNAISPIINTMNNAASKKLNVNRFLGFGADAIESNDKAQQVVAGLRSSSLTDIDTATNTAQAANRNSASSVNTLRALDAATVLGKTRSVVAANDAYAGKMAGLLGQRSELENIQDKYEMTGEYQRDLEDKGDSDNYYSNMAENLVNFGTNLQGIGKNLNTAKSNRVDSNLISQLSVYGLGFDKDGNLIKVR